MEYPTDEQIAEAIVISKRAGETEQELEARIESLCRLSDQDLADLGIVRTEPAEGGAAPGIAFDPVPLRRRVDGWTAERQRSFIAALAETGCVSEACAEVGITPRSAYRLREHPGASAFRAAWDHAQSLAAARLTAIAWERAIHGASERLYKNGEMLAERRKPSDRLLMWLLSHHDPVTYGWLARPPRQAPDESFYPAQSARRALPELLGRIEEVDCPAEILVAGDYHPFDEPPRA